MLIFCNGKPVRILFILYVQISKLCVQVEVLGIICCCCTFSVTKFWRERMRERVGDDDDEDANGQTSY